MNEPSLIERPRVLVLFRNPLDRKLVVRFLEERDIDADVVGDSDQMESLLEGSFSDFSLVILDLDVALAFGPRLLSKGDEIERPLPILLALPADASAPHWLAKRVASSSPREGEEGRPRQISVSRQHEPRIEDSSQRHQDGHREHSSSH